MVAVTTKTEKVGRKKLSAKTFRDMPIPAISEGL